MTTIQSQHTVGELVKDRPARSRVFETLGIDYCCGGKLTLDHACAKHGLDLRQVLERLAISDSHDDAVAGSLEDVDALPLDALADHIEQTHHAYLKRELPRLGAMVRKVAAVHGNRFPWMLEVDGVFSGLAAELESHMLKEEQMLFPMIRTIASGQTCGGPGGGPGLAAPIRVMEHEHDDAGGGLERIRELTGAYTAPDQACNTFRASLDGLSQLERDLHHHVHKENNILFPKALAAEQALSRPAERG